MSEKRFTLTERRELTLADGTPFAEVTIRYHNLDTTDVVELERELVGTLTERLAWAEAKAAGK